MILSLPELIGKKRDGEELTDSEIRAFVQQTVAATAQDCQIGAMLMAIFLRGMTDKETLQLTSALIESGEVLTWPEEWRELLADKHSTGGVGDKVSLPLAPALAACGLKVPMVSGRGLDFTGGTLDKLESIPGYTVTLDQGEMTRALREAGCFIAGQTDRLVPGDRELYKRRDVTATVQSTPLVIASIVSKKAAEGLRSLVMDIKVGRAGVFQSLERARELAVKLIHTATDLGVQTRAVLTHMDAPIGRTVGNALEVAEALDCLHGRGPEDLLELVTTLGGALLQMQGKAETLAEGQTLISETLKSGRALACFETMLRCQGVSEEVARQLCRGDMWEVLPRVPSHCVTNLLAPRHGFVNAIDGLEMARVCRELGAGRKCADQVLDLRVGVRLLVSVGAEVSEGQAWLEVHHSEPELAATLRTRLENTLSIEDVKPRVSSRVIEII